ncbi:MAG TPA: hypothetical protein VGO45_09475 [Bacteroidia bacterium]|jgi:hypothetical protein|nr:hypothetical protein [Bacteroidia bacterium]
MLVFKAQKVLLAGISYSGIIRISESGIVLNGICLPVNKEINIPFRNISAIEIRHNMISPSNLTLNTLNEGSITIHGLSRPDMQKIKECILLQKIRS